MKKSVIVIFLFIGVINANSQTQYKYPTIDYFANDIIYVHKYGFVESKFNLLNHIFMTYNDWDKKTS